MATVDLTRDDASKVSSDMEMIVDLEEGPEVGAEVPAGQAKQSVASVDPFWLLYVSAAQATQLACSASGW